MDLVALEIELKKRWQFPYNWQGKRQNNERDEHTAFIYKKFLLSDVVDEINAKFMDRSDGSELRDYALNRWYNYWSARAIEYIFATHPRVVKESNVYHQSIDFYIDNIPFDHKTSVYPKAFNAKNYLADPDKKFPTRHLINWLYASQSIENRHHYENRLFIVLYDSHDLEHWKLKAEILGIRAIINNYLDQFDPAKLHEFYFKADHITLADIIWVHKK